MRIKQILKLFIPPVFFSVLRVLKKRKYSINETSEIWSGNYATWHKAEVKCTGYDANSILEKCKNSLLSVKNGESVYERDSVLFNEIQYSWGLLAGLQKAALENNGSLCVLDFGGSLGSTYYQNKNYLSGLKNLTWCIVEQKHFVDCGKENFESEQLKFYYSIEECMKYYKPTVVLLSSVLQYLESPYKWLDVFIEINAPYIILDRTSFIDNDNDILTVQNVPESIYKASYPAWFFGRKIIKEISRKYKMVAKFNNGFTPSAIINDQFKAQWEGIIFKK